MDKICIAEKVKTRMWADAQRDGRPAKYTWRPLLNAIDQIVKIFAHGKIPLWAKSPQNVYIPVVYQPRRRPNIV